MKKYIGISTVERRRVILEQLKENKQVFIGQLSEMFAVSEVTLRKDLRHLEEKNLLIRSRGGAMLPVRMSDDLPVEKRQVLNHQQKTVIAKTAVELINEGDTILLDSGTTIMELASLLNRFQNLTVITNALNIVLQVSKFDHLKIIVPGGVFRHQSFSLTGISAVENIKQLRADKYFVSADGITENGLFTANMEEGQMAKIILSNARKNIVLADSSKFSREALMNFGALTDVDVLVTDKQLSKSYLKLLREENIDVLLAGN